MFAILKIDDNVAIKIHVVTKLVKDRISFDVVVPLATS